MLSKLLLVIEVICATPRGTIIARRGVLTIVPMGNCPGDQPLKKNVKIGLKPTAFDDNDLEGTIQSHDDALVVAAQISCFLVKK